MGKTNIIFCHSSKRKTSKIAIETEDKNVKEKIIRFKMKSRLIEKLNLFGFLAIEGRNFLIRETIFIPTIPLFIIKGGIPLAQFDLFYKTLKKMG